MPGAMRIVLFGVLELAHCNDIFLPAADADIQCDAAGFSDGGTHVIAYKKVPAADAGACCTACGGEPLCGHWVFRGKDGDEACHLKSGPVSKTNQAGGTKRGEAPPSPPPPAPTPTPTPTPAPAGAPNILLLFPDQWRYDWDGFHTLNTGELPLKLPVLQSLASRGVRFTQNYVPAPVCAPSRSCLASGREYDHTKVPSNKHDYSLDVPTFYSLLRAGGYHVMTTGKDDLTKASQLGSNTGYPGCPECRDGDGLYNQETLGFSDGLRYSGKKDVVDKAQPHEMYGFFLQNNSVINENGMHSDAWQAHRACMGKGKNKNLCDSLTFLAEFYEDDFTAANAVTLLQRRPRDQPFFLHVSFPGPHAPFLVTSSMRDAASDGRIWPEGTDNPKNQTPGGSCSPTGEPDTDPVRCNYAAEIENLDRLFKVVLDEVEAQGETENTLVFITSDHGEMLGDHGDTAKSKPWQGSASTPMFVVGPGVGPGGKVVDSPVGNLDMVGTFLDYAGVTPHENMTTVTMRGLIERGSSVPYRSHVSSGLNNFRMVVKELQGVSYKYICCKRRCPDPPSTAPKVSASGWMQMLIDVKADPFDMHDLSLELPEVVAQLRPLLPTAGYSGDFAAGCATISADGPSQAAERRRLSTEPLVVRAQRTGPLGKSCGVELGVDGVVLSVALEGPAEAAGVSVGYALRSAAGTVWPQAEAALEELPLGSHFVAEFVPSGAAWVV